MPPKKAKAINKKKRREDADDVGNCKGKGKGKGGKGNGKSKGKGIRDISAASNSIQSSNFDIPGEGRSFK